MGFSEINDEQKMRINLSKKAQLIVKDDMNIFSISTPSTFINTVFTNYRSTAKSSISLYLEQRSTELFQLFYNTELDASSKEIVIEQLLSKEKTDLIEYINQFKKNKGDSNFYYINNENLDYLKECNEDTFFNDRPAQYIKCIIEEYCSLPFIERTRIFKKQIFEVVETACKEHKMLKVKIPFRGNSQTFHVRPYRIVSDLLDSHSYLVCYSQKENDTASVLVSFSMERLPMPTILNKTTVTFSKEEIKEIEEKTAKNSPAFLVSDSEEIHVRLTKKGQKLYQTKFYSRPDKIKERSSDNEYTFICSQQQIFNYFYNFGAEAEILSPAHLRKRIRDSHQKALAKYSNH